MARRLGRPTVALNLSAEERTTLQRYIRRRTSSQQLALRSRIVLECARGSENQDVAVKLDVTPHTVGKWRRRFAEKRLDGLHDGPRPGAPRTIEDDKVEEVIVRTLESRPKGATHWSTRQIPQRQLLFPISDDHTSPSGYLRIAPSLACRVLCSA